MTQLKLVDDEPTIATIEQQIEETAIAIELTEKVAYARIGQYLAEAKPLFKYDRKWGGFEGWVKERLGRSGEWAKQAVTVHEAYQSGKLVDIYQVLAPSAQYEAATSPAVVQAQIEEMLVDGEKVTVAEIRRLKAELKAAEDGKRLSEQTVESLTVRNAELLNREQEPDQSELNIESLRDEIAEQVEKPLADRIEELNSANVKLAEEKAAVEKKLSELESLIAERAKQSGSEAKSDNVVQLPVNPASVTDEDAEIETEKGSAEAISGAVGTISKHHTKISAASFWKVHGKKGSNGKTIYSALLSINATIGMLIKEYNK